jgi:outer membrane receptor protein involved in Fe transport
MGGTFIASASALMSAAAMQPQPPPDVPPSQPTETGPPIVITGSRIPTPNRTSPSPIETVRSQDFVMTGVPNVEETLNQLPQLIAGFTNTSNNPGTGAATLDLRGLGSVRTLILVNGRRWIANDAGQIPEVDVNTIPAALIDRVDIVTGGASAVYGSDAVTGVINFVLKSHLEGLHLEATQNITTRLDGQVSSASLSYGTGFLGGRGSVIASVGWLDQTPVLQDARALSRVALQEGCAVPGTRAPTGASEAVGLGLTDCGPPFEIALIAGGSGTIPGSRFSGAVVPVPGTDELVFAGPGIGFQPDGNPRILNPSTDLYNFAPANYLQVGFKRWSGNLLGSVELSPAFEPYTEVAYIKTRSPQQLAPVPASLPVAVNLDNPFLTPTAREVLELSYGVDADGDPAVIGNPRDGFERNPAYDGDADGIIRRTLFSRLDLGDRRALQERKAMRGLAGVRGELAPQWNYDVYFSKSHVDHRSFYINSGSAERLQQALLAVRDPVSGDVVCIDPSNGCAPANVFGVGNISSEAAAFIHTDPVDKTIVEEEVGEASVHAAFNLLTAGPAGVALGASWRRTGYHFTPDPTLDTGDDLGFFASAPPAGGRTGVWELFGEARVPLLADVPLARAVPAELGLRYSNYYDSVGGVWTWKALGEWVPLPGVRIRGGFQHAVRGPNVRELYAQEVTQADGSLDPCSNVFQPVDLPDIIAACIRNGVPEGLVGTTLDNAALVTTRGSPDLKAEIGDTFTLGIVASPGAVPGLSLAADYYNIRIRDAISIFGGGSANVVNGCIQSGADPADPICQAYARAPDGSIATVDLPTANLGFVGARGIDWQVAYARTIGAFLSRSDRIDLSLSGTYYLDNIVEPNSDLPAIQCAGYFGGPCGNGIMGNATPRWKLFNRLSYLAGPVTLAVRHRWFSSTLDARIAAFKSRAWPLPILAPEGRRLEARHYFDLAATFRATDRFALTLGVNNLTDAKPAVTGTNQIQANTDPSLYDVLGRRFFVSLAARIF